jgi:hypothetical protein
LRPNCEPLRDPGRHGTALGTARQHHLRAAELLGPAQHLAFGHSSLSLITTPTRYARLGEDIIILVGHPEAKTWWHNFSSERDIDV